MAAGLRIWDASGNLIVDLTTRMGRVLGTAQTGTSNGSISPAGLNTGDPFIYLLDTSPGFGGATAPSFSFTSTTISWTWPSGGTRPNYTFIYGVR